MKIIPVLYYNNWVTAKNTQTSKKKTFEGTQTHPKRVPKAPIILILHAIYITESIND